MLDREKIDLADLALALEDHSRDHGWWFNPATGDVESRFEARVGEDGPVADLIAVDPLPSSIGYADMDEFVGRVHDPRAPPSA
jgi:hypothetical protein